MPMMRNPYLRNMFTPPKPQQPEEFDWSSLLDSGNDVPDYEPETPYRNRYMDLLSSAPNYQDLKPSLGRRLASALISGAAGFAGNPHAQELGNRALLGRYNSAMENWNRELGPARTLAETEKTTIEEKRKGMKDRMTEIRDRNKYLATVMNYKSMHEKRMADIENTKDDNEREDKKAKEIARHNAEMEKLRADYNAHARTVESNRERHRSFRDDLAAQRAGNTGNVKPAEQRVIDSMAYDQVRRDPRFAKWWNNDKKMFTNVILDQRGRVQEEMDPETEKLIKQMLAKTKEDIANKKRGDYTRDRMMVDPEWDLFEPENDNDEDDE